MVWCGLASGGYGGDCSGKALVWCGLVSGGCGGDCSGKALVWFGVVWLVVDVVVIDLVRL